MNRSLNLEINDMNKILICDCGLPSHQVIIEEFDDGDVVITMHVPKMTFWQRIKVLFNGYPRFEGVITTKEELNKLFIDASN